MGRTVTLVLLDAGAGLLGALPPFDVDVPWWQEVDVVVDAARARHGIGVQVLRLLTADGPHPPGGHVTYLAQTGDRPPHGLTPVDVDLSPQPHRAPYAEPGGPVASATWAVQTLAALGTPGAVAVQQRTWNLSAIWRLDVDGAPVAWLKQVPAFFAHEAAVLGLVAGVAPGLAPPLLAAGPDGRMLLAHAPGEDRYGAGPEFRAMVAEDVHPVQAHFVGRAASLLAAGVPDRRDPGPWLTAAAEPYRDRIPGVAQLIDRLPERLRAVAACGMPDTLVHGDLHPGNVRSDGTARVLMDWGDATVGHPALDILRLTGDLPHDEAGPLIAAWAKRWRSTAPGCDPERAVDLMRPVAALCGAAVYADFVARIEPSEWPYHADDVPAALTASVAAVH
ncbi:MAG TPA: aminoglycoside phosphotransferase family protein [Actinoplanes sp.]